jgi:hypothetical protein
MKRDNALIILMVTLMGCGVTGKSSDPTPSDPGAMADYKADGPGNSCPQAACDPTGLVTGGCATGACYFLGDAPTCAPRGTTEPSGLCGTSSECVPGDTCVAAPGSVGGCARVCVLGSACAGGLQCAPLPLSSGGTSSTFGACLDCDPVDPAGGGCVPGSACVLQPRPNDPSGTTCMHSDGVAGGAPCGLSYSCSAGFQCIANPGQVGTCERVCLLGSSCDSGLLCRAHDGNPKYGTCEP